jgi:hypothetical protein
MVSYEDLNIINRMEKGTFQEVTWLVFHFEVCFRSTGRTADTEKQEQVIKLG